jgi:hypothetical protein
METALTVMKTSDPCGCGDNACCGECLRKERRHRLATVAAVIVVLTALALFSLCRALIT